MLGAARKVYVELRREAGVENEGQGLDPHFRLMPHKHKHK